MRHTRDWIQSIENVIEAAIIEWIIKRRGVEFIYWLAPKKWEEFINEENENPL